MQDIQVTDYLTWEYCHDPEIQYLNCSAPESVFNHMPQWFKDQKAHKEEMGINQISVCKRFEQFIVR